MSPKETLVVARSWPRYSEVWMHRMNETLLPDVCFASLYVPPNPSPFAAGVSYLPLAPRWLSRFGFQVTVNAAAGFARKRLGEYLERHSNATVLCHYLPTALLFEQVWKKHAVPLIVHCHGHDATWGRRRESFPKVVTFGPQYQRRVLELSKRAILIANSLETESRLRGIGVDQSRIRLKYLGVPIDLSEKRPKSSELHNHPISILYLGRLIDCKGPLETIKAFELACDQGMNGTLTMAGAGPQMVRCRGLVKESRYCDRICLTGAVPTSTAMEMMDQADIFTAHNQRSTLTGEEEAYGVSIVEAMSKGLPVVTGRSGGVRETVVNGKTGYLFNPGDIAEHASLLCRLAEDRELRNSMGANARQRVKDHFSQQREAEVLSSIINEVQPANRVCREIPE